jgi:hypothetical protein
VPAIRLKVITPRRAIKNYQLSGLINLGYVVLGLGLAPWEWFWVVLAGVFDLGHLVAGIARRRELMRRA